MEGHNSDLRGDMYDVIFKTIYLFLETNEFYTTAKSFLSEIKTKYNRDIDKTLSNARTLVLRPYYERSDAATVYDTPYDHMQDDTEKGTSQESEDVPGVHFDFDRDYTVERVVLSRESLEEDVDHCRKSEVKVEVLTPKSKRVSFNQSQQTKNDPDSSKSSLCEQTPSEGLEQLDSCAACGTIERIRRDLEYVNKMAVKEKRLDRHDLSLLRESFLLLQTIQGNHVKLINLAKNLSSAILKLDLPSKDHFLTYYQNDITDLYSYTGKHCTQQNLPLEGGVLDRQQLVTLHLTDIDDPTDYQIESSFINSSNESNNLISARNDAFIPLESKPVVGDIPGLKNSSCDEDTKSQTEDTSKTTSSNAKLVKIFDSSAMSSFSNEDVPNDEERSPSRFGTDFNAYLKPPKKFRDEHQHRINKSATLPSVNVGVANAKAKSHSASQLDSKIKSKSEIKLDNIRNKKRHLVETSSTKLEITLAPSRAPHRTMPISLDKTSTRRTPKPSPRKIQKDTDLEREYQSLIKEKTKVILEREKSRLEKEINKINKVNKGKKISDKVVLTKDKFSTTKNGRDGPNASRNNLEPAEPIVSQHGDATWRPIVTPGYDVYNLDESCASDADQKSSEFQFDLDWCALKKALFDETPELKMKILQALRWRLLYSEERHRDKFVMDYVKNDVLSINTVAPYGQLFLESFYCPKKMATPHTLQEEMSRFINTLASLSMGRFYLERDESLLSVMLLPLLMGKLPGVKISDTTREFVMATVQKLSLSNKIREIIISTGAVEWLVTFIEKNHSRLSTYEAEYSTALLTNLCINKEGRNRCERVADRVVSVIDELVVTPHKCCLPYINPILYNLLLNPVINERAFSRGIGVRLKRLYIIYGDDDDLKRQLDAIISMHERREFCDCDDAETEELSCQNYADFLEQELSQNDPVYRAPFGEPLLKSFYLKDGAASSASLRSFYQNDNKHPAIVQKNCNCNYRYDQRHLAEETRARPVKTIETNNSNKKWTARHRERHVAGSPYLKESKFSNKSGNSKKAKKQSLRQRSFSQPPASKHKEPSTSTLHERKSPQDGAHERSKIASLVTNQVKGMKQTKYIVNCCYKMDYVNAIAAPPGEFLPSSALNTSSPNLQIHDGDDCKDDEKPKVCDCYDEMKDFLVDCTEAAGFRVLEMPKSKADLANKSKMKTTGATTKSSSGLYPGMEDKSLFRRQSTDSRSLVDLNKSLSLNATLDRTRSNTCVPCVNCKESSLFDMKNFTDDDDKVISYKDRGMNLPAVGAGSKVVVSKVSKAKSASKTNANSKIRVGDYHVVNSVNSFDEAESPTTRAAILKLYDDPKQSNKR